MSRSENLGVYTIHHTPAGDGTTENYTITKAGSGSVTLIEDTDAPGVFKADSETVPNSWMGPVELAVESGPAYEFKTGSLPLTVTIGEGGMQKHIITLTLLPRAEFPKCLWFHMP